MIFHKANPQISKYSAHGKGAFKLIFIATSAVGIPITNINPMAIFPNRFLKIWCILIFSLKTVSIFLGFPYVYKLLPNYASSASYYLFNTFSYVTALSLFLKRKKIIKSVKSIAFIWAKLTSQTYIGSKTIKYEIILFIISSITMLILFIRFFLYQEFDIYLTLIHVPFTQSDEYLYTYTWIVALAVTFSHFLSFTTCFITLVLSYSAFISFINVIESYASHIRKLGLSVVDSNILTDHLRTFKEISLCNRRLEKAFSLSSFLLYGTVIGGFFATISVMFSQNLRFQTPLARIYVGVSFIGGLGLFFVLTTAGSRIQSEGESLKIAITECSEKMAKYSFDAGVMRLFILLSNNIKESHLSLTGCGMFTINKGLILTVGGMTVTYSFLLFQLNSV